MKIKKIALLFLMSAAFFSVLFAEDEKRVLTVEEAVILAADNNIDLKRNRLSLELLEKKDKFSWSGISPAANISGNFAKPLDDDTYSWSVSAALSLNLTPSLYTTMKSAALEYESGKISYEEAVRTVELNVRKAFYSLIYQNESIALSRRNLETARQRYELSRDKYNRGQLSELDLLSSQVNYENLKPSIESAVITYENNLALFKQMLGIDQSVQIELDGSLKEALPAGNIDSGTVADELPSVKRIMRSIEAAENSLLATRFSAWGPSLTAGFSYGVSGSKMLSEPKTSSQLSLGVRIPLDGYLPWSSGALGIASQKASLENLRLQLEDEKTSSVIQIENSLKGIRQAESQLASLNNNAELAQRSYDMTLAAYNYGSKDLLTLQNASDSLMQAKTQLQSQYYTIISAVLDLENTLGVPFGTLGAAPENSES